MARQLRIEYPGALYHLLSRSNRGKALFRDDRDRQSFLETLGEACAKTGWQVHAYCLLQDHFHLVLETPQPNLSIGMKWFLGAYAIRFQHRHNSFKSLFSGRFKSTIIDASVEGSLRLACDFVHLNPVRTKLLSPRQPLEAFRWSSYPQYLMPPTRRPHFLHVDWLMAEMGIATDSESGRRKFASQMEQRRRTAKLQEWAPLQRGWYLGDKTFRKLLLDLAGGKLLPRRSRPESAGSADEKKARRILREELAKLGWNSSELARRSKGHPDKIRIAHRIRSETTVTHRWLAEHLKLGSMTYAVSRLARLKRKQRSR